MITLQEPKRTLWVYWHKRRSQWQVTVSLGGGRFHVGFARRLDDAVRLRNEWLQKNLGGVEQAMQLRQGQPHEALLRRLQQRLRVESAAVEELGVEKEAPATVPTSQGLLVDEVGLLERLERRLGGKETT